jgi:hypothetical protein
MSAVNPVVAFYDIHGRKKAELFFNSVPHTTQDTFNCIFSLLYTYVMRFKSNMVILKIVLKDKLSFVVYSTCHQTSLFFVVLITKVLIFYCR